VEKGTDRAAMETPLPLTPVRNDREIGDILRDRRLLAGRVGLELDVLPVAVFERMKREFSAS
jgi:hypothetical protein